MSRSDVTFHDLAAEACAHAVDAAIEAGVRVTVIVLDSTFNVAASLRMDGAFASAFTLARAKAWTALNFGVSSASMAERLQPENKFVVPAVEPNILFIGGGFPIVVDGVAVGAVGVSGGSEADDSRISELSATGVQSALDEAN
jgi:uncharacterized protein GlcG (DUF336 family)